MEQLWVYIGFTFAAYSVVANDSVQTLGTWIASNRDKVRWQWMWIAASAVLIATLWIGWFTLEGDISYGRLNKIPYVEIQWYHAAAPAILLLLTRIGIPVSTSFLVLSAFASTFILEKMIIKSVIGYGIAAICAYAVWIILGRIIDEKKDVVNEKNKKLWRIGQWITTGFLWHTWLSHDMANIAVFLPRDLSASWLVFSTVLLVSLLGYMLWEKGGKIQQIVVNKTGTRYVRSATIIDFVYAVILLIFKEYNDIPMSTTWVFVGLLCGRELAISTVMENYKFKYVFPIISRDFGKMLFGALVSVAIVLSIHYIIVPGGYY
ncbi:MAG: hypothetical protein QMB22_00320 [Dehalococcoidia bacterium]|jgi:hypothetical protein|nr:MAG: hypothetical protein DK305_000112 [Chloroflexota bacterium]|tara:strand:+ start:18573 stop:19532 length:960 start_codon:yes stop_codon:yes gene_type:complete